MTRLLPAVAWFFLAATALAQAPLPVVDGDRGDWVRLREQCRHLMQAAEQRAFLNEESIRGLRTLVDKGPADPAQAMLAVQKLLDPFCLIGVTINPESRVKVARGPGEACLTKNKDTLFLVKVNNEAGVTAGLGVSGSQVISRDTVGVGRWLEAGLVSQAPLSPRLLGQRLEYVVLRLRPHEAGKREATLKFDVGQGSQDLGFRAEVPILFRVQEKVSD